MDDFGDFIGLMVALIIAVILSAAVLSVGMAGVWWVVQVWRYLF